MTATIHPHIQDMNTTNAYINKYNTFIKNSTHCTYSVGLVGAANIAPLAIWRELTCHSGLLEVEGKGEKAE